MIRPRPIAHACETMKKPSQSFHGGLIRARDSHLMTTEKTRALTLLAAVPATFALAIGVGAGTASAQTESVPAAAEQGVVHYNGIFDDLDDLHVPHHIRNQVNAAVGSLGIAIPWHLLDGMDDDLWDDDNDDQDDGVDDRDDRWDD